MPYTLAILKAEDFTKWKSNFDSSESVAARKDAGEKSYMLMQTAFDPNKFAPPSFHIFAGGLLIGAFFMATDMVTSPITPKGTWIYALGIGLMVGLVRLFGGFPEGVMYSILFMNTFVPLLNRYFRPRILGERRAPS